jgi:PAS domain S-box-containing protein
MIGQSASAVAFGLDPDELRAALDAHAIVAVTDRRGDILYANDKFCEISRYSRAELLGQNHRILKSGHHPPQFYREMWATVSSGNIWHGEIRNRAKDGSSYWVATTIVPFLDKDGNPYRYVSIRTDITGRKLAEEAMQRQTEALARSNAALAEFAYAASHDLQEPVRGMAGCADILLARYAASLDPKARLLVEHVAANASRMQELIRGLLDLAHVEQPVRTRRAVDCNALVEKVLATLSGAIEESGAKVRVQPLPSLLADPAQLARVFENLVANALKFGGAQPPEIQISASPWRRASGDGWEFVVTDNGPGVDPAHREDIFRPFYRMSPEGSRPGMGIGLAICRRVVEVHGGHIWVEQAAGGGAAFHFRIAAPNGENE